MSYAMSHFILADQFAKHQTITDSSIYYLASIAPDAVHARADFQKEIKTVSHFMQKGVKWGEIYTQQEMDAWYDQVRIFYQDRISLCKNQKQIDFLNGYTVHIITDIFNCQLMYAPFFISYGLNVEQFREDYRVESIAQDNYLFQTYEDTTKIMDLLQSALEQNTEAQLQEILQILRLDHVISARNIIDNTSFQMNAFREAAKATMDGKKMITIERTHYFLQHVDKELQRILFSFPPVEATFSKIEI